MCCASSFEADVCCVCECVGGESSNLAHFRHDGCSFFWPCKAKGGGRGHAPCDAGFFFFFHQSSSVARPRPNYYSLCRFFFFPFRLSSFLFPFFLKCSLKILSINNTSLLPVRACTSFTLCTLWTWSNTVRNENSDGKCYLQVHRRLCRRPTKPVVLNQVWNCWNVDWFIDVLIDWFMDGIGKVCGRRDSRRRRNAIVKVANRRSKTKTLHRLPFGYRPAVDSSPVLYRSGKSSGLFGWTRPLWRSSR